MIRRRHCVQVVWSILDTRGYACQPTAFSSRHIWQTAHGAHNTAAWQSLNKLPCNTHRSESNHLLLLRRQTAIVQQIKH